MTPTPSPFPSPAPMGLPAAVLEAFQRYRSKGDPSAVEDVVIAAVVDYRPAVAGEAKAVTDEARLVEDLGYDSVAVAELVFFLEDLFDLAIANEDIRGVSTIGDLRACVVRKLAGKPGPA